MAQEKYVTTIKVSNITHDRLTVIGKKNQTYDDIINMLLDKLDNTKRVN